MTTIRKLGVLSLLFWLSVACETALREPMCHEDEMEFPAGAEGRYSFALPTTSAAYSGALTDLTGVEFLIRDLGDEYEIEINEAARLALTRRSKRFATRGQETPIEITLPIRVCRIGERYYVNSEAEGTYALQRFDLSPTGITTTGLAWRPEDLERHGFRHYFAPQLSGFSGGEFDFDMIEPTKLIVDNRNLSPKQREALVRLAQPTAVGTVFSRIGPVPPRSERGAKGGIRWRFPKAR